MKLRSERSRANSGDERASQDQSQASVLTASHPPKDVVEGDVQVLFAPPGSSVPAAVTPIHTHHRSPPATTSSAVVVPSRSPPKETTPIMRTRALSESGTGAARSVLVPTAHSLHERVAPVPPAHRATNPLSATYYALRESSRPFLCLCAVQFFLW